MKRKESGFSVIEVMLVVIMISILAAIVIPRFVVSTKRAKVQSCEMNRAIINKSIESFFLAEASWPGSELDDIKTNANYFPDGIPTCPIDQTSYVMGPDGPTSLHRVSGHREGAGTHTF